MCAQVAKFANPYANANVFIQQEDSTQSSAWSHDMTRSEAIIKMPNKCMVQEATSVVEMLENTVVLHVMRYHEVLGVHTISMNCMLNE